MLSDDAFVNVLAEVAADVTEAFGIAWQGDKTLEKIKPEWKGSGETPGPARDAHPAKTGGAFLTGCQKCYGRRHPARTFAQNLRFCGLWPRYSGGA
jgi:hypothetical protein